MKKYLKYIQISYLLHKYWKPTYLCNKLIIWQYLYFKLTLCGEGNYFYLQFLIIFNIF
jgi:hypothetical protein